MFDTVTLDQMRALVTVVEEGSFSAAARALQRVQSAVSAAMANLEAALGVPIWDRSTKVPTLTPQGRAVLAHARRVLAEVDQLRRDVAEMAAGLEPSVSLCVDALYPVDALIAICGAFVQTFPTVELRIDTEVMSAVSARVVEGGATLGVMGPHGLSPALERHALSSVRLVPVVAPSHPLASTRGRAAEARLAEAIQIVLSERIAAGAEDQGVLSPRTWRIADLHTKHRMLLAGLGWGSLPEHLVRDDLRAGRLVALRLAALGDEGTAVPMSAVHRRDAIIGPAHRWLLERLRLPAADAEVSTTRGRRAGKPEATEGGRDHRRR